MGNFIPLERGDSLPGHVQPEAQRLDTHLGRLLEGADAAEVRAGRVAGAELAGAGRGPAALGVVARAGVAAGAGGEDGGLAGLDGGGRCVEDEAVAGDGCHGFFMFLSLNPGRRWDDVGVV